MGDLLQLPRRLDAIEIPPGLAIRPLAREPKDLMNHLLIWEKPRNGKTYVIPVDVSEGLGQDRSVIDVIRVADLHEPHEQVAQFITDSITPEALAWYIDPIGKMYSDSDGFEAKVAIEINIGPGVVTQNELQQNLNYGHFFIWEFLNARNPRGRYSNRFGWYTSRSTRPMILSELFEGLKTIDEHSGLPDLIVNSPFTLEDIRNLQVPKGYPLAYAEAAPGCHDDCVLTLAIGHHVAKTSLYGEGENIAEKRRRVSEEEARKKKKADQLGMPRTSQNTDVTADEIRWRRGGEEEPLYDEQDEPTDPFGNL